MVQTYKVKVCRMSYDFVEVAVEAEGYEEAKRVALKDIGTKKFSEGSKHYEATDVNLEGNHAH